MEEEKEYFAFISYNREDEKWAKWLADKIEHYHLPTTLNGKDLPNKLRPIFRDVDELSAGNLPEQIYSALSVSKNLIVVCSPRAAKSKWVEKEIEDFVKLKGGRADNVFPFIIEGVPHAKDADNECLPDALRNLPENEERLGGAVNEQGGRNAAVVKIIAGMLGIGFDTLWQKYEKEKRWRRNMQLLGVIAFAVVALGIALWLWRLNNQISITNKKLVKENICVNSREVLNLLEKGKYVEAKHQVKSILELWNKECRQEIPEMEKALRALYRYQWRDGIVKLYSMPISDRQRFLSADSTYLYISDKSEGYERIVGYAIETGDSAKQIFSLEGEKRNYIISDYKYGIIVCHNITTREYDAENGTYTQSLDTICVFDQENGKKIIEKGGFYDGRILDKDNLLFMRYDRPSSTYQIELAQINSRQLTEKWNSFIEDVGNAVSLVNDSLIIIGESKVFVLNIRDGKKICEVDYEKDVSDVGDASIGNPSVNNWTKQYVNISEYGLRLFSADRHHTMVLDKSDQFSSAAFNPSGSILAAVKACSTFETGKDSILIYFTGLDYPLYAIEGVGLGDISFADDLILVERNSQHNRINVYSCLVDISSKQLFSSTGDYYVYLDSGDSLIIYNDSTEEAVCDINKSGNHITNVYGFSPQDTYLLYATDKNPLVMHHIKKDKDVIVPMLWENVEYRNRYYCISDDDSKMLCILHNGFSDYITLYDLEKNAKEMFSVNVTIDDYHDIHYALNSNGSRMALSDGSKVNLFQTDSILVNGQSDIVVKEMENCSVRELRFFKGNSPLIAVSYSDGTIRFWNTITGEQVYGTIQTELDGVLDFDISNDSKYLIGTKKVGKDSWEYLIWHIPSGLLVDKETNAWCWWAYSLFQNQYHSGPSFRAFFAKNSNELIVNDNNLYGLSRKFSFPSFDELVKRYSK